MKKLTLHLTSTLVLGISLLLMNGCKAEINNKEYLQKVLKNLEQINSATFYSKDEIHAPGDKKPSFVEHYFTKEYSNPTDTFVGAKFVTLLKKDTTILDFCYDGKVSSNGR